MRQVIDNCRDFKELMRTQQDTLNEQYLTILRQEVQAYWVCINTKKLPKYVKRSLHYNR